MATRNRWHRWRGALAYGLLVVALGFTQWRHADYEADQRAKDRREERAADYQACLRANVEVRLPLRKLVEATGQGTDLTQVEGFEDTPEWFQQFVENLRDASASASDFQRRAATITADRDCAAEYPGQGP